MTSFLRRKSKQSQPSADAPPTPSKHSEAPLYARFATSGSATQFDTGMSNPAAQRIVSGPMSLGSGRKDSGASNRTGGGRGYGTATDASRRNQQQPHYNSSGGGVPGPSSPTRTRTSAMSPSATVDKPLPPPVFDDSDPNEDPAWGGTSSSTSTAPSAYAQQQQYQNARIRGRASLDVGSTTDQGDMNSRAAAALARPGSAQAAATAAATATAYYASTQPYAQNGPSSPSRQQRRTSAIQPQPSSNGYAAPPATTSSSTAFSQSQSQPPTTTHNGRNAHQRPNQFQPQLPQYRHQQQHKPQPPTAQDLWGSPAGSQAPNGSGSINSGVRGPSAYFEGADLPPEIALFQQFGEALPDRSSFALSPSPPPSSSSAMAPSTAVSSPQRPLIHQYQQQQQQYPASTSPSSNRQPHPPSANSTLNGGHGIRTGPTTTTPGANPASNGHRSSLYLDKQLPAPSLYPATHSLPQQQRRTVSPPLPPPPPKDDFQSNSNNNGMGTALSTQQSQALYSSGLYAIQQQHGQSPPRHARNSVQVGRGPAIFKADPPQPYSNHHGPPSPPSSSSHGHTSISNASTNGKVAKYGNLMMHSANGTINGANGTPSPTTAPPPTSDDASHHHRRIHSRQLPDPSGIQQQQRGANATLASYGPSNPMTTSLDNSNNANPNHPSFYHNSNSATTTIVPNMAVADMGQVQPAQVPRHPSLSAAPSTSTPMRGKPKIFAAMVGVDDNNLTSQDISRMSSLTPTTPTSPISYESNPNSGSNTNVFAALGYNPAQHPLLSPPQSPSRARKLTKMRSEQMAPPPAPVPSRPSSTTPPLPESTSSSHGHGGSSHGHGSSGHGSHGHGSGIGSSTTAHSSGIRVHQHSNGHRTIAKARPTTPQKGLLTAQQAPHHAKSHSVASSMMSTDTVVPSTSSPTRVDDDTMRNAGIPLDDDPFACQEGVKFVKSSASAGTINGAAASVSSLSLVGSVASGVKRPRTSNGDKEKEKEKPAGPVEGKDARAQSPDVDDAVVTAPSSPTAPEVPVPPKDEPRVVEREETPPVVEPVPPPPPSKDDDEPVVIVPSPSSEEPTPSPEATPTTEQPVEENLTPEEIKKRKKEAKEKRRKEREERKRKRALEKGAAAVAAAAVALAAASTSKDAEVEGEAEVEAEDKEDVVEEEEPEAEPEVVEKRPLRDPPLTTAQLLVEPQILANLISYLSFSDWLNLSAISREIRVMLVRNPVLKEVALERYLKTVGYAKWNWDVPEPLTLSLQDLADYMRGVSIPTHEYARVAGMYVHSLTVHPNHRDPSLDILVRLYSSATRAYNRVLLRLRAQAEKEAAVHAALQEQLAKTYPPSSSKSAAMYSNRNGSTSRISSRAPSPTSLYSSAHGHYMNPHANGSQVTLSGGGQQQQGFGLTFKSTLFRMRRAPLLRVFVPSQDGDWLSDKSVLECEAECKRAGILPLMRFGDVVWDIAVGDEGNVGRLIWDGSYLIDLDYTFSATGDIPKYIPALAFPPSYFHRVVRTGPTCSNPIVHIDISPWGEEIAINLQLLQDRVRTETPQGAYHNVVRWVHRSSFTVRPPRGPQRYTPHGTMKSFSPHIPIPETELFVDSGWYGTIVVETEGTNEALADLQMRCGPNAFPPRPRGANHSLTKAQAENKKVWRILREKSRPGEIWLRAVSVKERLI